EQAHHRQRVPDEGRQVAGQHRDLDGRPVEVPPDDESSDDRAPEEDGCVRSASGRVDVAKEPGQVPGPAEGERLPADGVDHPVVADYHAAQGGYREGGQVTRTRPDFPIHEWERV